jgi:tetratricopeptide (TPR) repeat protein
MYASKRLRLEELIRKGDHVSTMMVCHAVIALLKKNPVIFRKERLGFAYGNISHCQIYKGEYTNAVKSAKKAQTYFNTRSIDHLSTRQQEFHAYFYSGKYSQALITIRFMLRFPNKDKGEFRHDKYLFMLACTLFQLKKYKLALNRCDHAMEISKDKGRWDTGMRYLRVMCLVELEMEDQASFAIEALRKALERNNRKGLSPMRDELIYKALNEYSLASFSGKPAGKLNGYLQRLSEKSGLCSWACFTPELIPVHNWILSRIKYSSRA